MCSRVNSRPTLDRVNRSGVGSCHCALQGMCEWVFCQESYYFHPFKYPLGPILLGNIIMFFRQSLLKLKYKITLFCIYSSKKRVEIPMPTRTISSWTSHTPLQATSVGRSCLKLLYNIAQCVKFSDVTRSSSAKAQTSNNPNYRFKIIDFEKICSVQKVEFYGASLKYSRKRVGKSFISNK